MQNLSSFFVFMKLCFIFVTNFKNLNNINFIKFYYL